MIAAIRRTPGRFAARIAIATSGGTFGLAVAHAVRAAQLPPGRIAQQHVVQLARIGQLDLGIDLVRDPTSATFAVLAAFIGFAAVLHAVWMSGPRVSSRLAWTGLATSATLLAVLADDLPTLAVGLQLATLAGWALAGGGRARALGLALAGDTSVVFAAWILFWSLGGTFGASGFTPDPMPRFALVAVPETHLTTHPPENKATVALTTYEDALVSSDDGPPLPGEPLRAPFQLTLDPGTYSFRIQAGAGTMDLLVTHVSLAAGHAYVLTPFGPTTSIVNLEDQLAVPRPAAAGAISMRATLGARTLAALRVPTLLGIAVVLAALLRLTLLARSERGGLGYVFEGLTPVVLVMHIAPLLDPPVSAVLAIVPAFAAVVLGASAASSRSRDGVARAALAVLAAIALASILLGESSAALVIVGAATLGTAAMTTALDSNADVRWLGVACAGLTGVLPGGAESPGIAAAIAGAFGASASGRWAGSAVAPLLTVAVILLSLALFRVYGASINVDSSRRGLGAPFGPKALVVVLSAAALLGGAALGAGSSPFGGRTQPYARRLVNDVGGLDDVPKIAGAALALSLAAALLGLLAARRATRTPELPGWVKALAVPGAVVAGAADACASLLRFFVRSVVIMNEDVIDDATDVLGSLFGAIGAAMRKVDARAFGGRVARTLGGSTEGNREGMADAEPHHAERFQLGLVLGMVALLGLVVLSSVVLG
jgi:hypothetical protein